VSRIASAVVTVPNKLGLHARPATIFVETASSKKSQIKVRRCDQNEAVDGKSVLHMMLLAATEGTKIEITAHGCDADEAVDALVKLVSSGFEEE
jgi:phosphocarrier protein